MKCDFPDDTVWPTRTGAEIALGLKPHTISRWVHNGWYKRPRCELRKKLPFMEGYYTEPDSVRMGDIRELVEAHKPLPRRDKPSPEPEPVRMTLRDRIKQKRLQQL